MSKEKRFKKNIIPAGILAICLLFSCENVLREEHYHNRSGTYAEGSIWEELSGNPDYSVFLSWMEVTGMMDSLSSLKQPFTLFVPPNDAFQDLDTMGYTREEILGYHILSNLFIPSHVTGARDKFETISGKFTTIRFDGTVWRRDGAAFEATNRMFSDGTIYVMEKVVIPVPTVYDYWLINTPVLAEWYLVQDSIVFDLENSTAIGFDSLGNTIYDSVLISVNLFDKYYFPVSTDIRDDMASFLCFTQEDYHHALNKMALSFGGTGAPDDYKLIPKEWQFEVYIPLIMKNGVFAGAITHGFFNQLEIYNINNELVSITAADVDGNYKYRCSNGLIFHYLDLTVPDSLYRMERKYEGEHFLTKGIDGNWIWDPAYVTASKSNLTIASTDYPGASGGACATVQFVSEGDGEGYYLEFVLEHVFAGTYEFRLIQNNSPACIFDVYINGEKKLEDIDNSEYYRQPLGFWYSSCEVVIPEFGDVIVRLEFDSGRGYPASSAPGMNIDYFDLTLK